MLFPSGENPYEDSRRLLGCTGASADRQPYLTADVKYVSHMVREVQKIPEEFAHKLLSHYKAFIESDFTCFKAHVPPGTTATIEVEYASDPSHVARLELKSVYSSGKVSWSWHVGRRTTIGTWPVKVSDNGASDQASFKWIIIKKTCC